MGKFDATKVLRVALNLHDEGVINLNTTNDFERTSAIAEIDDAILEDDPDIIDDVYAILFKATEGGFNLPSAKLSDYIVLDRAVSQRKTKNGTVYHYASEKEPGKYLLLRSSDSGYSISIDDRCYAGSAVYVTPQNCKYQSLILFEKSQVDNNVEILMGEEGVRAVAANEALSMYDDNTFVVCQERYWIRWDDVKYDASGKATSMIRRSKPLTSYRLLKKNI